MYRLFILLILSPGFSYASPSFDCTKASTVTEKAICADNIGFLRDQDSRLAELYRNKIKNGESDLLKKSQRDWLRFRDKTCASDYELDNENCLHALYGERINELENEIVSFHIRVFELPYEIEIGNLFKGKFVYVENEISGNDEISKFSSDLFLINNDGRKSNLWSAVSEKSDTDGVDYNLKSVTIYIVKNNVILKIDSSEINRAMTSSGSYEIDRSRYFTISSSGQSFFQGEIESGGGVERTYLSIDWSPDISIGLSVKAYSHRYDNFNYLIPVDFFDYEFNLTGESWKENAKKLNRDLENEKGVNKYLAIYQELDSRNFKRINRIKNTPDLPVCIENGIDWSEVAISLNYWLGIAMMTDFKMIRDQSLYAIPKLFNYKKEYNFSKSQKALAVGLNHYRELIESTPQWKEKFDALDKEQDVNINTMENIGFPSLNSDCSNNVVIPQYGYIKFNRWLYTFWLRRYLDGSYDSAKSIVKYYAAQD